MSSEQVSEHFTAAELYCQHCGDPGQWETQGPLSLLEDLRAGYGIELRRLVRLGLIVETNPDPALPVTSGHRCRDHPIEVAKRAKGNRKPGPHIIALGVDFGLGGSHGLVLTVVGYHQGWYGHGWHQKTDPDRPRLTHLDRRGMLMGWTY